jgi:hypothetical protein
MFELFYCLHEPHIDLLYEIEKPDATIGLRTGIKLRLTNFLKNRDQINKQLVSFDTQKTVRLTTHQNAHTGIALIMYRLRIPSLETTNWYD